MSGLIHTRRLNEDPPTPQSYAYTPTPGGPEHPRIPVVESGIVWKNDFSYRTGTKWTPRESLNAKVDFCLFIASIAEGVAIYKAVMTALTPITFVAVVLGVGMLCVFVWRVTQGPDLNKPQVRDRIVNELAHASIQQIFARFDTMTLVRYNLLRNVVPLLAKPHQINLYIRVLRLEYAYAATRTHFADKSSTINNQFDSVQAELMQARRTARAVTRLANNHARRTFNNKESSDTSQALAVGAVIAAGAVAAAITRDHERDFVAWQSWYGKERLAITNAKAEAMKELENLWTKAKNDTIAEANEAEEKAKRAATAGPASPSSTSSSTLLNTDGKPVLLTPSPAASAPSAPPGGPVLQASAATLTVTTTTTTVAATGVGGPPPAYDDTSSISVAIAPSSAATPQPSAPPQH